MSNKNWIDKLQLTTIEEPDGSLTIQIDWDPDDPELFLWTSWSEEKQKQFFLDALTNALNTSLTNDTQQVQP